MNIFTNFFVKSKVVILNFDFEDFSQIYQNGAENGGINCRSLIFFTGIQNDGVSFTINFNSKKEIVQKQ